ncbi:hypothetical protein P3T76_002840 [Phytophthora citrophthora]|uniref:Uncharacterized protein n=1 Tax=Phytophthora citrophthora TaxID=4793 RepID=A0AAD9GW91_9STRA|nr:hypothetical protein P3T76_002840 [Phytophthora citrophthora]
MDLPGPDTAEVDDETDFNMFDFEHFISALAKRTWTLEPDADDPNLCNSETEMDESDEVEPEAYIAEVMSEPLNDSDDAFDDLDFFDDVANEDWTTREGANNNPDFLSDAELKAIDDE